MITSLKLGIPVEFGPIEMWPVTPRLSVEPRPWAGYEALRVDEAPEPDPGRLWAQNDGQTPVFLPVGFLIGGLQQSRMLLEDLFIGVGEDFEIPVACVEAGRFSGRQASRQAGRAPVSVLAATFDSTSGPLPRGRRQTAVWDAVMRQERRSGTRPTHSLEQVMQEDLRGPTVQRRIAAEIEHRFTPDANQIGAVIAVSGAPLLMETFESPALASHLLTDLLRSVAFDVDYAHPFPSTPDTIKDFVRQARRTSFDVEQRTSGSFLQSGSNDRVSIHGTWRSPKDCLHLLAINHQHPILQGAAL